MNTLTKNINSSQVSALAVLYGPAFLFLTVTILAYFYSNIPFGFFSRDPTTTAKMHPLTGIQSNMGVLVWWAGGTICLFCHLLLRQAQVGNSLASFFLWSGILTCILTLDDFFLFHDYFAWRYLRLSQKMVYLAYATFSVWYLIKFRQIILNSNWLLFFAAFAFFGLSVFMDLFLRQWPSPWRFFFEDGFKLIGIVSWSGYLIQTCLQALRATIEPSGEAAIIKSSNYRQDHPVIPKSAL